MSYSKKLLDHFENPRNIGEFDDDFNIGIGIVGSPSCGDVLKLSLKIENQTIKDAKFLAFGCGAAIASSSLITEKIIGKSLQEVQMIDNQDIAEELELPPIKLHCSVLAKEAIESAVHNFQNKKKINI